MIGSNHKQYQNKLKHKHHLNGTSHLVPSSVQVSNSIQHKNTQFKNDNFELNSGAIRQ
jgi:hypothetical protein